MVEGGCTRWPRSEAEAEEAELWYSLERVTELYEQLGKRPHQSWWFDVMNVALRELRAGLAELVRERKRRATRETKPDGSQVDAHSLPF
jgi:hypothetical protein